jgi:hypothetical protein
MRNGNRLLAMAIALFALAALAYGCQTRDGSFPTEADRSLEQSVSASQIYAWINIVITDPTLGKSATSQFKTIERTLPKNLADAQTKAKSLVAFILKHYQAGKWVDPVNTPDTGDLVAAIYEYVGLAPAADAAEACIPNVDCEVIATVGNEFGGSEIPGDAILQSFVIYLVRLPDDFAAPPLFPIFYEIHTIPEGITFPPAPSGSLSLAQADDGPVAGLCTLDENDPLGAPEGAVPGVNLFLSHQVDGEWERLPYVDVTFLDCEDASSETESALWSSPLGLALSPVIDLLSPARAYAGGKSTGGAITSFSEFGSEYTGPIPTTTTLSIVEGTTSFTAGQTITLRAVVDPVPDGGNVLFYATNPTFGPGAPVVAVVDGVATHTFTCGSTRVPFGSHTAQVQYMGTSSFEGSVSNQIAYTCSAG